MSDRPDYCPTAVDVVLRPEWSVVVNADKILHASAYAISPVTSASYTYVVPAGKKLYVTSTSYQLYFPNVADRNNYAHVGITINAAGVIIAEEGSESGDNIIFPEPLILLAGETIVGMVFNHSAKDAIVSIYTRCYEVDA